MPPDDRPSSTAESAPIARSTGDAGPAERTSASRWTFLTNHAMVFACLAQDPEARLRDVAEAIGITERAVQHIVADLEAEGFLRRERAGRRNRYALDLDRPLRRPLSRDHTAREVVALVRAPGATDEGREAPAPPAPPAGDRA